MNINDLLGFRRFPGSYKENSTCWIRFWYQIWPKIDIFRPIIDPKYRFINISTGKPEKIIKKWEKRRKKGEKRDPTGRNKMTWFWVARASAELGSTGRGAFVNLPGEAFLFDGFFEQRVPTTFQPLSSGWIFWLLEFVSDEIDSWLHPFWMIPI